GLSARGAAPPAGRPRGKRTRESGGHAGVGPASVEHARDEIEKVALTRDGARGARRERVTVAVRDRAVLRPPMRRERGEDPEHELVGHDLIGALELGLAQILRELRVEKLLLIVERLRVVDRALHERLLELGIGLEIEDQRVLRQRLERRLVVELAEAAARVVDEMVVAVDLARLDDELGHVAHRADLGLAMQLLALLELVDGQPAEIRAADLAEEARD